MFYYEFKRKVWLYDEEKNVKKKAFTLAEVLLTIGIIGIVATLTIPQLIQKSNDKELVSGFLKTHSVLFNAFKQAEVLGDTRVSKIANIGEFKTFFESHLKTLGTCDSDVCLADGAVYDYDATYYSGCTHVAPGAISALKESCLKIVVDVNGTKGPNKPGKDIYNLWVTTSGIYPEGLPLM